MEGRGAVGRATVRDGRKKLTRYKVLESEKYPPWQRLSPNTQMKVDFIIHAICEISKDLLLFFAYFIKEESGRTRRT